MKLDEVYIDGFGMFHNYRIEDLTPGLTILVGPNEAGKSTILAFLKRVLFGFPTRRSRDNPYPPLSGGNHGGRLFVSTGDDSEYVVERFAEKSRDVKLVLPDGSNGGPEELSRLLGNASKDVFENVYAFGLTELQDFDTLNSEAVKGRIYSAGAGIGAVSLAEIQESLQTEIGQIFKERGSKPEINKLLRGIGEASAALRQIEKDTGRFDELHNGLEEIDEEIENAEKDRKQIRIRSKHASNLRTAWDDWRRIENATGRLKEIPEMQSFPRDGIGILDGLLEKTEELDEEVSEKKEELSKLEMEKSLVKIDAQLISSREKILELQTDKGKYVSATEDLPSLRQELETDREGLTESLHEIGSEWNEERLSGFDTSIPTKEIVIKQRDALYQMKETVREFESKSERVRKETDDLLEEIHELDEDLETFASQQLSEKELGKQRSALRTLRASYPNMREKEFNIRSLEDKEELLNIFAPSRARDIVGAPIWPAIVLVVAGIVSLAVSMLESAWILGIFVLGLLSAFAVVYAVLRTMKRGATGPEVPKTAKADGLIAESGDLSARRETLELELQNIRSEMLSKASLCGFDNIPLPPEIESKDSELQTAYAQASRLDEMENRRELLDKKLKKLEKEKANLEMEVEQARRTRERGLEKWRKWLTAKGLEEELSPEGAIDVFAVVKACVEKKKSIYGLAVRIERIETFIGEYEKVIASVLEACGRKRARVSFLVELEKLTEELGQALENRQALEQMEIDTKKLKLEISHFEEKLEELRTKVSNLLSQGAAESEAEFRENADFWEERNNLKVEITQAEQNIKKISGEGQPYLDFIDELKTVEPEILEAERSELEDELNDIERNLSTLREDRGANREEIRQIERRKEGSSLRMERAVKLEKLKKMADRWSVLILAQAVLNKAIEKYERERQPEVIKEAQTFFSNMTLGRYSRILAPLDEATIYVEDQDGRRKSIEELSRGTAEQLYLSLRFGFIRELTKRTESLPVVFDDVLVNFDPDRFRAACGAIEELTETNQVLYFTCHPETVDSLTKVMPDSKVIDIGTP